MPPFRTSAVVAALVAFAPQAIAGSKPSPAAAPYLERGLRFYATQRYADAVAELTAGYQVDPHPDFLYAIGQSHRMSGDCKAAIDAYRAYLRTEQPALESQRAQDQIQRCEAKAAPPPIVRRESFGTPGYVLASGGAVSLGLGVVALIAGKHHASDAGRARTLEEHDSHAATARNYRIAGGVALAGGAALVTLAVVRFLSTRTVETRQPVVSASIGNGEVAVGAVFSF